MIASGQRRIADLAADAAVNRAFRWLHLHDLQLRRWHTEFLAIPAPPFHEDSRARWFCRKFRLLGLQQSQIDTEGNALAVHSPVGVLPGGPAILLSAHLDTVFPPGTPCVPTEDGPRIFCPGACDNGAGLTALLAIAAALQHSNLHLPCPVIFTANVGEEGEGDLRGMRHLFAVPPFGLSIHAAIALEGAGEGLVVDRALGSRRLRVTVSGPGGHSWADVHRPNPILALSAALLAVARLPLPRDPRTTLNVGTFGGGTSVNSIPEIASAQLDLRSVSVRELDRLEVAVLATLSAEVAAETRGRPDHDQLRLGVERIGDRPVGALRHDTPLYESLRAVDRHLGIQTEPRMGSTDANLPLARNIPALALGCGGTGGGLHSTSEWYDPTGREVALRRILLLLLDVAQTLSAEGGLTSSLLDPALSSPEG